MLPFYDKNPSRHWEQRKFALTFMSAIIVGMVFLTIRAVITTPPQKDAGIVAGTLPAKIAAGLDIYSVQCNECHGPEGEGVVH